MRLVHAVALDSYYITWKFMSGWKYVTFHHKHRYSLRHIRFTIWILEELAIVGTGNKWSTALSSRSSRSTRKIFTPSYISWNSCPVRPPTLSPCQQPRPHHSFTTALHTLLIRLREQLSVEGTRSKGMHVHDLALFPNPLYGSGYRVPTLVNQECRARLSSLWNERLTTAHDVRPS